MKHIRAVFAVVSIALCLACIPPVMAQNPPGQPDWWGSSEGFTVSAVWDLDWDNNYDLTNMTLKGSESKLSYTPHQPGGSGYQWHDDWWGAKWDTNSRKLTLDIGNIYCPDLEKTVWAYWDYAGDKEMDQNDVALFAYDDNNKQYTTGVYRGKGAYAYDNGEGLAYQYWKILPQPEWERIVWTLPDDDEISEIRVGTHCTPELSTWVLLLFTGTMGVRLCRRKKNSMT